MFFWKVIKTIPFIFKSQKSRETVSSKITLNPNRTNRKNIAHKIWSAVFAEHIQFNIIQFIFCSIKFFLIFLWPGFSIITQNINWKTRTWERMTHYKFIRKTKFFSNSTNFILIQITNRFNNQSFRNQILNSLNSVMMSFDCIRILCSTWFNNIRIKSSLSQKPVTFIKMLSRNNFVPDSNEIFANSHTFFLRICKTRNSL